MSSEIAPLEDSQEQPGVNEWAIQLAKMAAQIQEDMGSLETKPWHEARKQLRQDIDAAT